ncbi:putative cid1 family poly A polymerase [Lyophyllum shimeji]|uniref:Cid1 family poly A polymerase n=1 Tax=Lyophyllum shimeji TaxID=47721 RepID=A0A9P3UQ99_LYOSH|nr:putative cid1 family poly A polymerase [Lyophyllum shimeji]
MKDPPSSASHREARRRSHSSRPYADSSSSKGEGPSSRRSRSERKGSPRRAKSASKTPPGPDEANVHAPWLELLPKGKTYNAVEHRLHYEILAYLSYMEQTPKERQTREAVMAEIRRVVHERFRNAEVNVFGSTATGLSLPTSDIDIVLMIPHIQDVRQALFQLSAKFKTSGLTSNVFVNHRAPVPIIILTLREEYGPISVDIGINNPAGMEGLDVMKGYLKRMPALRPLILVIKGFLRQRKLNDASKGGLGSYPLACLCIHFLQTNPGKRPQEYIDKPFETESLGFLLTDFMFYYGFEFPHATSCISVYHGKLIPKPEPSDMLCVRCPRNPENNISKSIHKAEAFLRIFKEAYATILQLNLADQNMLGQIVAVNQKFLDERALMSGTRDVVQQLPALNSAHPPLNGSGSHTYPCPPSNHQPQPHPLPRRPSSSGTHHHGGLRTVRVKTGAGAGAGRPHALPAKPNPSGSRS